MCVSVWQRLCMCVGAEVDINCPFLPRSILFSKMKSLGSHQLARVKAYTAPRISLPCPSPSVNITVCMTMSSIATGCWALNLELQVNVVSTLSTKPSPHPQVNTTSDSNICSLYCSSISKNTYYKDIFQLTLNID